MVIAPARDDAEADQDPLVEAAEVILPRAPFVEQAELRARKAPSSSWICLMRSEPGAAGKQCLRLLKRARPVPADHVDATFHEFAFLGDEDAQPVEMGLLLRAVLDLRAQGRHFGIDAAGIRAVHALVVGGDENILAGGDGTALADSAVCNAELSELLWRSTPCVWMIQRCAALWAWISWKLKAVMATPAPGMSQG